VILLSFFGGGTELDPVDVILPLALAGVVTFALFSVLWLVQLFADEDQGSKKHESF
jgi:lipid-A-disaccharide synthase-like uncharacterized protein